MPTDPRNLTNRQILKLDLGLSALDGVMGDGGKIVRFKLGADVTWFLALDIEAVGRAKAAYERALKSLGAQHGVVDRMEVTTQNAAAVAAYVAGQEALLDQEQDMSCLHTYKRTELQEKNAIPPSVLANLLPVLEDE